MKEDLYDCLIIGAGPGGLTAALYLKRFQRKVLIIDGGKPRAAWIPKTKNLIGYHGGISGPTLLRRLRAQLSELQVTPLAGQAKVLTEGDHFLVKVSGQNYRSRKVLLATGIQDEQPPVEGISELRKAGLLRYCPICDGFEYRGKNLLVFVNSADCFEKIFFLFQFSQRITVLTSTALKLPPKLQSACRKLAVRLIQSEVDSIKKLAKGIRVNLKDGRSITADAAYVELGFRVRDEAFAHLKKLKRSTDGRIQVDDLQRTNIKGLFAVGDCVANLAQISVAAGQAAIAATEIHNELLRESSFLKASKKRRAKPELVTK